MVAALLRLLAACCWQGSEVGMERERGSGRFWPWAAPAGLALVAWLLHTSGLDLGLHQGHHQAGVTHCITSWQLVVCLLSVVSQARQPSHCSCL